MFGIAYSLAFVFGISQLCALSISVNQPRELNGVFLL